MAMRAEEVQALKEQVIREVERIAPLLIETSDWMADNPEIGLQEHQAAAKLTEMLEEFGAEVDRGIAGLPTAFEARLPGGTPGKGGKVAIVAEYDALADVGHGCGHNIIATSAIGAGIALATLAGQLPGSVVVLGTPAEESGVPNAGGKFHGRPAHAASNPHEGVNALDAMIVFFSSVGLLRQQVRTDARIHGVITYGGGAPNVIPPYTSCRFRVRGVDGAYCEELVGRIIACAQAGATATGCRMEWKEYMRPYLNMVASRTIGATFRENLEAIGRDVQDERASEGAGSTDFGNVSHKVPAVHAYLGICGPEAGWHSKEVAAATKTDRGHAAILAGAKSLAMTAIDLLVDDALRAEAWQEHRQAMNGE